MNNGLTRKALREFADAFFELRDKRDRINKRLPEDYKLPVLKTPEKLSKSLVLLALKGNTELARKLGLKGYEFKLGSRVDIQASRPGREDVHIEVKATQGENGFQLFTDSNCRAHVIIWADFTGFFEEHGEAAVDIWFRKKGLKGLKKGYHTRKDFSALPGTEYTNYRL